MNILSLKLTNFLSHKDTVLDFSNTSVKVFVGKNGAGKSSLVKDSITWGLFGVARNKDRAGDQLITEGEDYAEVTVGFGLNGDSYTVIRGRNRNEKSYLSFFKNDEEITGDTLADTQQKIERVLGFTYETFSNSACIEQGKLSSFSSLTPKEAKRVFYDILGLSEYQTYETKVRENVRIIQNDLIEYETRAKTLEQEAIPLEGSEEKLQSLDLRINVVNDARIEVNSKQRYLTHILEAAKKENQDLLDKLNGKREFLQNKVEELQLLESSLNGISSDSCPFCGGGWSDKSRSVAIQRLQEHMASYKDKLEAIYAEIETFSKKDFGNLTFEISENAILVNGYEKTLQELSEKRGYIVSMYDNQTRLKAQLSELQSKITTKKEEFAIYRYLLDAFGSNGIPTIIMSSALEEVQLAANTFLDQLTNGRFRVELRLEKELKGGGIADTLQLFIYDGLHDRIYSNFSGGEKARIDLAVRLGIAVVLARRNSYRLKTLIIDEASESLDEEGRDRFISLVSRLTEQFKKVLVISHTDVRDRTINVSEVVKENGVSKVLERV